MPLTIFGDGTAPAILPADRSKEKPRTLRIRFLSKREMRSWQRRFNEASVIAETDARDAAYDALMAEVVTGWENIPGDFSIGALSDVFTLPEFIQFRDIIPMSMLPGPEDLKKIRLAVALAWQGSDHVCTPDCKGTPGGSAFITCPVCEGEQTVCEGCGGIGRIEFFGCEYSHVTGDVWDLIRAAEMVEKGGWPNGVGWANEPAALVAGVERVWLEMAKMKVKT